MNNSKKWSLLGVWFVGVMFCFSFQPSRSFAEEHLNLSLWVNESINDDPSLTATTFKPALVYRNSGERLHTFAILAVLYNRIENKVSFAKDSPFSFEAGLETYLTIAGDSPKIDGVDYSDEEFKAHRLSTFAGVQWNASLREIPVTASLDYQLQYFNPYDFSSSIVFQRPSDFYSHGPSFSGTLGSSRPAFEVFDRGSRLHMVSSFIWRTEDREWGRPSFLRSVDHTYSGSLGGSFRRSFAQRLEGVLKLQGSYLSKADRINALSNASLSQETLGLTLKDFKSDRGLSGLLAIKFRLLPETRWIAMPLFHGVAMREIGVSRFRNTWGLGGGVKMMGTIGYKWIWEVSYANLFGARPDLPGIHDAEARVSYSFF